MLKKGNQMAVGCGLMAEIVNHECYSQLSLQLNRERGTRTARETNTHSRT